MRLSPHFTLEELIVSQNAARLGIDNTPNAEQIANLTRLARDLEMVRVVTGGSPLIVNSAFRCQALNDATPGSSKTSAHMDGRAADLLIPRFGTPRQVAQRLIENDSLDFDQLILEYDSWVHYGIAPLGEKPRRQVLTAIRGQGYLPGLV